jgi:hypothetical protein
MNFVCRVLSVRYGNPEVADFILEVKNDSESTQKNMLEDSDESHFGERREVYDNSAGKSNIAQPGLHSARRFDLTRVTW